MAKLNTFIDLSKHENSMTSIIEKNNDQIMQAQSVGGIVLILTKLFAAHGVDTPASNRLIRNVSQSRNIVDAQQKVYNSFLAGTGNAVC